jgi:hypothetical protein
MVLKPNLSCRIITMFLAFCVLLATGCFEPVWCEEDEAIESVPTGESLSVTPWTIDYIRKRPYLIYNGKPKTMTVLWQTYQTPAIATVEWGTTASYGKGPVRVRENGSSSDEHQFGYTISNLQPATRYYYRVNNDTFSHTGSFITAPPPDQASFSFYGYGDTQPGYLNPPTVHNDVLTALLSDMNQNPDQRQTLLVNVGDYVYQGLNEFMWDLQMFNLGPQYNAMHTAFASFPFMGVVGNHEGFDAYAAPSEISNDQNIGELFRKYYPYRYPDKNHFYYSFDYGPVHFSIIDTWSYQGVPVDEQTIDNQQESWLKRDLKASKKPWKIVMLHTPIWQCSEGIPTMQAQLTPILKQGGVHLVLQGHHHYYSHAETEGEYAGMTYLTLGGGGAKLEPEKQCVSETNKKWPPFAAFEFHFARFDISGDTITVTVIGTDGSVIETFQVTN